MIDVLAFVGAVIPTVGVSVVFWLAVKSMTGADRRERDAIARAEAERKAVEHSE